MNSLRLVSSNGWYFMMLLEIYYSGALTMFFSTEISVPFETMTDVMRAYPDWRLQMMAGMQVFFIYKVQDGDPDYVKFWDRVENLPDETTFTEFEEGIRRMHDDFGIVLYEEGRVKYYMKQNPVDQEGLKVFGKKGREFYNIIVKDNSPLGPVFRYGTGKVLETGCVFTPKFTFVILANFELLI